MTDADLAAELIARMDRDQQVRSEMRPGPVSDDLLERLSAVDADNTAWLTTVLDARGWPRRSDVGEMAARAAWLLAQHADRDVALQRRCLGLLEEAVRDGEADPANLAYLTDRVLRADGRPQLYGTQFRHGADGTPVPQPIADPERLDERRRAVGLSSFAEYERQVRAYREGTS
jgi:hypothetical protein